MTPTTSGWMLFITALGMMCGLLAPEISKLASWNQVYEPGFVAVLFTHFATVTLAFVAGKLIPTERDPQLRTRAVDTPQQPGTTTTVTTVQPKDPH